MSVINNAVRFREATCGCAVGSRSAFVVDVLPQSRLATEKLTTVKLLHVPRRMTSKSNTRNRCGQHLPQHSYLPSAHSHFTTPHQPTPKQIHSPRSIRCVAALHTQPAHLNFRHYIVNLYHLQQESHVPQWLTRGHLNRRYL